jgi:hypothetical protein
MIIDNVNLPLAVCCLIKTMLVSKPVVVARYWLFDPSRFHLISSLQMRSLQEKQNFIRLFKGHPRIEESH